jgi:hypothetical protein
MKKLRDICPLTETNTIISPILTGFNHFRKVKRPRFAEEPPKKSADDDKTIPGTRIIDATPKYELAPKRKPIAIGKSAVNLLPVLTECKKRMEAKRRTITLPESLGSVFPDTTKSIAERWDKVKFLIEHLRNIQAEETNKKIKALRSLSKRK